jgi:hypothetical protein
VVTPAVAPYVPTYASYTPYVSATEVFNYPAGVDVSQLVVGGNTPANLAALTETLRQASSEADRICEKPLAATLDVVNDAYLLRPDGSIHVPLPYSPLVAVTGVQVGYSPSTMVALPDLSGVWPKRNVAQIPVYGVGLQQPNIAPVYAAQPSRGRVYAIVQYVNGWAHSTLSVSANSGTAAITPASVLGIVPGLTLTIRDGPNTEVVTVAPSYVFGAATVPLTGNLQFTHAAGTTVSALPPFVKTAVINLAKWLVKSRGSKAVVMEAVQPNVSMRPKKSQKTDPGGDEDYQAAERALKNLRRSA